MTGTYRGSAPAGHPIPIRADLEYRGCCGGLMGSKQTGYFLVKPLRAKHQRPSCHASRRGDKLFTGSFCQESTYGMQVMRSGSLAVKSHQRRLRGLSSVKLSLSTSRWAAGIPSVTNGTIFPHIYPSGRIHAIFVVLCAAQQVVSPVPYGNEEC